MNKIFDYKAVIIPAAALLVLVIVLNAAFPKTITVSLILPEGQQSQTEAGADDSVISSPFSPSPENSTAPVTSETTDSEPSPEKGLNSTDPARVASFYCASRKTTKAPKGRQTLVLANNGKIEGGGLVGVFAKAGAGIVDSVLKKNSSETTWIPGDICNDILPEDVENASAVTSADGRYTDIKMSFKGQTDGPDGDNKNGGPVARGIGTLGSVDDAVNQLGASFKEGRENIKLIYSDAWLECKINNDTGMIEKGTWHYIVMLNISEAKVTFVGITGSAKNVVAGIDFTVTI